jgi:hypothetical protein
MSVSTVAELMAIAPSVNFNLLGYATQSDVDILMDKLFPVASTVTECNVTARIHPQRIWVNHPMKQGAIFRQFYDHFQYIITLNDPFDVTSAIR